jgi:ABC-type transport system involved in multi-copper enzyme maturation permease subunit
MKILGLRPRTVILITSLLLIAFLVLGILISTLWAGDLSPALETFLISLTASLVPLFGGILAAIFIVERYLEYGKKLREEQQKVYSITWQSYIEGGLSVLSALITHVCLFVSYGKERYLVLQEATGDTTDVPDTVSDFIPWLINNLDVTDFDTPSETNANPSVTKLSRGMGKDKALRFLDEFSRIDCISSIYTDKDLIMLRNFQSFLIEE